MMIHRDGDVDVGTCMSFSYFLFSIFLFGIFDILGPLAPKVGRDRNTPLAVGAIFFYFIFSTQGEQY